MITPSTELRSLVDRLADGVSLSGEESGRLGQLLHESEAMDYCCEVLLHEALLPEALATMETAIPGAGGEAPRRGRSRLRFWLPVAAAAGLMFLLGKWVGTGYDPSGEESSAALPPAPEAPKEIVRSARVTGLLGVEWEGESDPLTVAGSVNAGRLAMKTGLVELTYAGGVGIILEGPAEFTVTGPASGELASGKLVAYVPPGQEGFVVDYANGRVVDLGTEFAMRVGPQGKMELGVFDGEVELHLADETEPRFLGGSQAVVHDRSVSDELLPTPFQRDDFIRHLPERDFPWFLQSAEGREVVMDVSHLVWKPSEFRAIFKWISGRDGVIVENVELKLDGETVASSPGSGQTGAIQHVRDNIFSLDVPPENFRRGVWTLHARISAIPRPPGGGYPDQAYASSGVTLFEEGLANSATEADFVGKWIYHYRGERWVREFHSDGTISVMKNGVRDPRAFRGCRWWVENGVLHAAIPGRDGLTETHVLRNSNVLIFTNLAMENARRVQPGSGD